MTFPGRSDTVALLDCGYHWPPVRSAFTIMELLVVLTIISILGSLSMAGLIATRQRTKIVSTETTIRKIHEVVMPHYERLMTRRIRELPAVTVAGLTPSQAEFAGKGMELIARRRLASLELPDGWAEVQTEGGLATSADANLYANAEQTQRYAYQTAISRRLHRIATTGAGPNNQFDDAECLWAAVIRGGFADPAIVSNFRADEFSDVDGDGFREFSDAWNRPIRFLRWAPFFISRYQPGPAAQTQDHDAFDIAGLDPLARCTLFPLILSGGPDGEVDIFHRTNTPFSYAAVAFDPYFALPKLADYPAELNSVISQSFLRGLSETEKTSYPLGRPSLGGSLSHLYIQAASIRPLAPYQSSQTITRAMPFGLHLKSSSSDDVHNHSMSR